jgi:hypothetical protein
MANNFTDALALWRFEPGALTADSIGANTLTPSASPPTSDVVNFKEGAGSALFTRASSQFYHIADAALGAGFPFKNGDAVKKGTFAFRFRPIAGGDYQRLFFKWTTGGWCFDTYNGSLRFISGTGSAYTICGGLTSGRYYTVVFATDNATADCWVWDETANALVGNWSSGIAAIVLNAADLYITSSGGASEFFNGNLDEIAVFSRRLNYVEALKVRLQNYSGPVNEIDVGSVGVQVLYTDKPSVQVGAVGVTVFYTIPAPSGCLSATACAPLLAAVKPSDCSSHTLCPGLATPRPAGCLSLTACAVCPVYVPPPDSCLSATKAEALAAPPADCRSATRNGAIAPDWVENCRSTTISQSLLLAIPHICQSRTRSQGIPPFNEGLFLIF